MLTALKIIFSKREITKFEKDFLLYHEILSALYQVALGVTAKFQSETGTIPIHEFQIKTAHLKFGTLGGMLNQPENYPPKPEKIFYLNELNEVKENVREIKYNWNEIAAGVDVLKFNKDVEVKLDGQWLELDGKTISLTEQGLLRFYSKFYLKDFENEKHKIEAHNSTIITNFWMIILTSLIVISGGVALSKKEKSNTIHVIQQQIDLKPKLDTLLERQKGIQRDLKQIIDSLK